MSEGAHCLGSCGKKNKEGKKGREEGIYPSVGGRRCGWEGGRFPDMRLLLKENADLRALLKHQGSKTYRTAGLGDFVGSIRLEKLS